MNKPSLSTKRRSYLKGLLAEWLALGFLMVRGYRPLKWRYKSAVGEIDLVVKNREAFVFVEVKYRQNQDSALEAILPRNQKRVRRAAQDYMSKYCHPPIGDSLSIRFDVIVVTPYLKMTHLQNAF